MSLNPKARHYWTQLRAALTAGQWRSHFPAKTPNGVALSWSELFRKFIKHCRGAQDVAHVASYTHTLALFILKDPTDEDDDNDCLVSEAVVDQIKEGYEQLKSLQSSNLDVSYSPESFISMFTFPIDNPFRFSILRLCSWKPSTMYRSSRKSTRAKSSSEPYTNKSWVQYKPPRTFYHFLFYA